MTRRPNRGPIVAVVLLAILTAYVVFKERPAQEARLKEGAGKDRLVAFERSAVKAVTLQNEHGMVRMEKSGEHFAITDPLRTDADATSVDELLSALETSRIERRLGAATDLKSYGLDPVKTRITVEPGSNAPTASLGVGDAAPVGGGFFVLLPDGKEVAVAGAGVGDFAKKDLLALRDKTLLALDPWKVKRLKLRRGRDVILLEKPEDGWKIQEPIETPADGPTVTELLSALERLRASAVPSEAPGGADLRRFGLEPAAFSVTLLQEGWDVEKTVVFARQKDKTIVARLVGRAPVLTVPDDFWDKLNTRLADLRRKEVLSVSQYRLGTITAKRAGQPATVLTRQKDGNFLLTGPASGVVKAESADLFLRHLGGLKALGFEDRPDEALRSSLARAPALDLTLQEESDEAAGKAHSQHLLIGAPDKAGRLRARDLAWRPMALVNASDLAALEGDLATLIKEASEPKPAASPSPAASPASPSPAASGASPSPAASLASPSPAPSPASPSPAP